MSAELFAALRERNVSFSETAIRWFENVLPGDALAFDIEKGTRINENGANTWHRVLAVTPTCIFSWQVNGLEEDDEDALEGAHFETVAQIIPFNQVVNLVTKFVHAEDGPAQLVSATLTLASQDFSHSLDEHTTIFHDLIGVVRSIEEDSQQEVDDAVAFVYKLAGLYAASR